MGAIFRSDTQVEEEAQRANTHTIAYKSTYQNY